MDEYKTSKVRRQMIRSGSRSRNGRSTSNSRSNNHRSLSNSKGAGRSVSRNTLNRQTRYQRVQKIIELKQKSLIRQNSSKTSQIITPRNGLWNYTSYSGEIIGFNKCILPTPITSYEMDSSDSMISSNPPPFYTLSITINDKQNITIEKQLYFTKSLPGNLSLYEVENGNDCILASKNVSLSIINPLTMKPLSNIYPKDFIDTHLTSHYKNIVKINETMYKVNFKNPYLCIFANIIKTGI